MNQKNQISSLSLKTRGSWIILTASILSLWGPASLAGSAELATTLGGRIAQFIIGATTRNSTEMGPLTLTTEKIGKVIGDAIGGTDSKALGTLSVRREALELGRDTLELESLGSDSLSVVHLTPVSLKGLTAMNLPGGFALSVPRGTPGILRFHLLAPQLPQFTRATSYVEFLGQLTSRARLIVAHATSIPNRELVESPVHRLIVKIPGGSESIAQTIYEQTFDLDMEVLSATTETDLANAINRIVTWTEPFSEGAVSLP